ncbi:MAG TPA: nitrilase-related carbon-nitrogen hydrolase, partial [Sphingopyxis terrae]|nr:nitrilase-related carbon-nitrogen hydrolase [Sphingopyxis terrae]
MTDAPAATLSIVLSQMTQSVGDLAANVDAMRTVRARHQDADLILYPELQLIGYPPEDLVLKPALAERAARLLTELAADTADGGPAMLVGSVERDGDGRLYNIVALLDGGRVVATRRKHELPNYGTFDEKRVFAPGPLPDVVEWRGVRLGLPICEDGWFPTVCAHLAAQGAELL